MILEFKLKEAALIVAVDISLKRMKKSPERCARNLMELGVSAYPEKVQKKDRPVFFQKLLTICKADDMNGAKELFFNTFLY